MAEEHTAEFLLDVTLPGAKALDEDQEGDLIIEGYASDFGRDRQDEAFEPGAFAKGIDRFMAGQPSLLFHHHNDQQLGIVEELESRDDGLWMRARVPRPPDSSPLLDTYNKIKRGFMKGLSVRGLFKKRRGGRIFEADLAEISVTPLPINPRTLFTVAAKAFGEEEFEVSEADRQAIRDYFDAALKGAADAFDRARGAAD